MHPILPARVGWPRALTGLLTVSQYGAPSKARLARTNSVVFAQPNQPEANGEHACMGEDCDCCIRVIETRTRGQALGYVADKRRRAKSTHGRGHSGNPQVLLSLIKDTICGDGWRGVVSGELASFELCPPSLY